MREHFHVLKNGAADVPRQKSYMEMNQLKKNPVHFYSWAFLSYFVKKERSQSSESTMYVILVKNACGKLGV